MTRRIKEPEPRPSVQDHQGRADEPPRLPRPYRRARRAAETGRHDVARTMYEALATAAADPHVQALARNDLATLSALAGASESALAGFEAALATDPGCRPARLNLALLRAEVAPLDGTPLTTGDVTAPPASAEPAGAVRVAILSFLFNWPSTGGGIVHTVELARFLRQAGYDVCHLYARFEPWGLGRVEEPLPYPGEALEFDEADWTIPAIQAAFRRAVDAFGPDYVLITDSWNSKPLLAEAVHGYPYLLRFQAMEGLCPLNNVRLLPGPGGTVRQCPTHQLADPRACTACLQERGHLSGALHQAERALCGVGSPEYHEQLLRAFREAEAVLVVNPLMEALVSPFARRVRVVTAGMDPDRFPWPPPDGPRDEAAEGTTTIVFAGLVDELMKGFPVLHEACARLWRRRQDFELVATGEPPGRVDEFTRYVGWQSQAELPRLLGSAGLVAVPTVAQEALGRTAVEAMAAGRPVVASRLGGLPFTVADGATGLLCEPGDPDDLARQLEALLDDPERRRRLGLAGRRRFEEHYAWPVLIDRHYRPLLPPRRGGSAAPASYVPVIPERVDLGRLADDVAAFFRLRREDVASMLRAYHAFHDERGHARTLGELKTLCFEEAFVLYAALAAARPRTIVEIGTGEGKSTRRLLDLRDRLGLPARVVGFDVEDRVRHFAADEAELVVGDLAGRVRRDLLEAHEPDLIVLDAHPHALLREVIAEVLAAPRPCALAIHDCGRGLCNPRMTIPRDDPGVSSLTGVWERHVLAELLGVDDPLSPRLDALETPAHRLRIFDTPHGLAVLWPRAARRADAEDSASPPREAPVAIALTPQESDPPRGEAGL